MINGNRCRWEPLFSLFSNRESSVQRISNFLEMIVIQKFSRGQFFSAGGNGPRVPRKGKLGRGMRYADIPTSRLFPPPLSYPAIPRLERLVAFDDRSFRRSASRRDWRVGSRRNLDAHASGREGEGEATARSVEDLSSSNTGSSFSSPPRIPSRRLSSQENLHFSLIVLHQRACVHRDITAERSS